MNPEVPLIPKIPYGLDKDLLPLIALSLDLKSIRKICQSSKRFDEIICKSEVFWTQKLLKDYPNINIKNVHLSDMKKLYEYLNRKPVVLYLKLKNFTNLSPNFFSDIELTEDLTNNIFKKYDIQLGDVIIFKELEGYKFIWNGNKFVGDYGDDRFLFPSELSFPEFPPYYWKNIIDMDYVPVSKFERDEKYLIGKFNERYEIINEIEFLYPYENGSPVVNFIDYKVELA